MKKIFLLLMFCALSACQSEQAITAEEIVEKAIEKAGGERYTRSTITFAFREAVYTSKRDGGMYEFTRSTRDSLGTVKDVLTNDGFKRFRGGEEVQLPDSTATGISESVNSVHYFVQLPFGLNSPAVNKELVGEDEINGKAYYEVKVTFDQDGGGADHEDVYMYWIAQEDYTVDYLAYRFFVNDGGIRFRVAVNPRTIEGIRFVDYENYRPEDLSTPLEQLDELYQAGKLEKVSQIKNSIERVDLH